MPTVRAQVILKTTDNVSENFVSNSWAFDTDDYGTFPTPMTTIFKDFYDDIVGYLSPDIAQNGHEVKYYALPGTPPNYPFEIDTFNLVNVPSGAPLPEEVSLCLSFQGVKGAGFPQARRRGRVYIGPLDSTALGSDGRPTAPFITALSTAAATLGASVNAMTPASEWGVWSITDQLLVPIADGWVDNSWDTQRRRGVDPTSRTTFVV